MLNSSPPFTIELLMSSISSGIADFGTFVSIIFQDEFFRSLVLILVSMLIILIAMRIIIKFTFISK